MKSIFSIVRNCMLVAAVFFSPLYPKADDSGFPIVPVVVVVAGALVIAYCVQQGNHNNELDKARASIDPKNCIDYEKIACNAGDDAVKARLEKHKKDLNEKWIFNYNHGMTVSWSARLSGRTSAARVYCLNLDLEGQGFIKDSVASNATSIDGNFIINNSRFKNNVSIDRSTEFVSFNNCLLGNVKQRGKAPVIIELDGTVVEGNIVFEKSGSVVIDKTSVISGSVINGKLVRK